MSQGLDDAEEPTDAEEEPRLGAMFLKAAAAGVVTALILIALLAPVAWFLPLLTTSWMLRTALAFGVAWVLFSVIHRAAGMVGWPFSALVAALTPVVLLSHHVIFAIHGVPTGQGLVSGSVWLDPGCLLLMNGPPMIGLIGCIYLRHDGGADWETVVDILRLR